MSNYTCNVDYDITGATTTAWVFLGVFVVLIFGDGLLTGFALRRAIYPDAKPFWCCC